MRELCSAEVGNAYRAWLAERLETQQRTNRVLMYRFFGEIADPPDESAMVPALVNSLAGRLRIAPREVRRRMKVAARIGPRRQLSGPPLPPPLPHVAAAMQDGVIGEDHLRVISRAITVLPSGVSVTDRDEVEAALVREAAKNDAEHLRAVARRIDEIVNPDGDFDEADRARRRGLTLGQQGRDGMSRLAGWIDPETRAYVEAVTAAVRPGRHLPDDSLVATRDERSGAQRCHDGVKLGLKAAIASGGLGTHRGHAVTVIVRTTLAELN
jgi:predicted nucleic acid-binding protein